MTSAAATSDASLLGEFRAAYTRDIATAVTALLGVSRRSVRGWLLAPVRSAHARRRNFFRSALLRESASAAGCPAAAPMLGACAEIGWTCALILDDVVDRSEEREGGPSTHREHGIARSVAGAVCALLLIAWALAVGMPSPWRLRVLRLRLGVTLVLRAARGAVAPSARSMSAYARAARRVNSSIEWSLLAPFAGAAHGPVQAALRGYAAHSALAGKMRNDLLDYWGGSSERDAVLEDFHRAKPSFPVLVLCAGPLSPAERARIEGHFGGRHRIDPAEMFRMLDAHRVRERCLSLLAGEIAAGEAALAGLPAGSPLDDLLRRWNRYMLESCRARLLQPHS